MEVRSGDAPSRSYQSDALSPRYRIANGHERLAEVEVCSDDSTTVVDVNHIAREKEIVDQCNDSAVRCQHWFSNRATEIDAEVTTGHAAVEDAARSELTGDHRRTRSKERSRPHRR